MATILAQGLSLNVFLLQELITQLTSHKKSSILALYSYRVYGIRIWCDFKV